MRNAFEPLSIMSITWDEGRLRFRQPLKAIAREKYGAPYMTAHRADLHNLLRRATGDTPLQLGAHCIGADTVNGTAVARFADGSSAEADIVIGADGIAAIRAALVRRTRFTGMVARRLTCRWIACRSGRARRQRQPRRWRIFWLDRAGRPSSLSIGVNGDKLNMFCGRHGMDRESWYRRAARAHCRQDGWNGAAGNVPPRRARSNGAPTAIRCRNGAGPCAPATPPIRPCRPWRWHDGDRGRICAGAALVAPRRGRLKRRSPIRRAQTAHRLGHTEIARQFANNTKAPPPLSSIDLAVRQ